MNIEQLTYLFSIVLFVGLPLLVKLRRDGRVLKKYEHVLIVVVAISVAFTPLDYFALKWRAWEYSSETTLGIIVAAEIETYLFAMAVTLMVASVTLTAAYHQDRSVAAKKKHSHRRRNLRSGKRLMVAGATKR